MKLNELDTAQWREVTRMLELVLDALVSDRDNEDEWPDMERAAMQVYEGINRAATFAALCAVVPNITRDQLGKMMTAAMSSRRPPEPKPECATCDPKHPGILWPWNVGEAPDGFSCVERCDTCERYASDMEAAAALIESGIGTKWKTVERPHGGHLTMIDAPEREHLRYSWTQPCCNDCWEIINPGREPTRMKAHAAEKCVHCGQGTVSGVYVRVDPALARYPTNVK